METTTSTTAAATEAATTEAATEVATSTTTTKTETTTTTTEAVPAPLVNGCDLGYWGDDCLFLCNCGQAECDKQTGACKGAPETCPTGYEGKGLN